MNVSLSRGLQVLALLALSVPVLARPVSYADGHMLMADHTSDMDLLSYTYSPSFRWSASVGALRVDDLARSGHFDLNYVRASRLLHRWNLPSAQANVFGWAGLGEARTASGSGLGRHVGIQLDYETKRVYTSFVSELHEGGGYSNRFDTATVGWAPYAHDVDRMATWIVLKGQRSSGAIDDGVKPIAVLRFFTSRWWVEVGADGEGSPVANVMLNL